MVVSHCKMAASIIRRAAMELPPYWLAQSVRLTQLISVGARRSSKTSSMGRVEGRPFLLRRLFSDNREIANGQRMTYLLRSSWSLHTMLGATARRLSARDRYTRAFGQHQAGFLT